jgi:hypothetical protein
MKTRFFLLSISFISLSYCYSQSKLAIAGIYKTKNDFLKDSLSYTVQLDKDGQSFKKLFFLNKNVIQIKSADTLVEFKKGEIFGYYKGGSKFRYIKSESDYVELVARNEKIDIYKVKSYLKSFIVDYYYFSLNLNEEFISLTKKHLYKYFKNSPEILKAIKGLKTADEKNDNGGFKILDILN